MSLGLYTESGVRTHSMLALRGISPSKARAGYPGGLGQPRAGEGGGETGEGETRGHVFWAGEREGREEDVDGDGEGRCPIFGRKRW